MGRIKLVGIAIGMAFLPILLQAKESLQLNVIPKPNQVEVKAGSFVFKDGMSISAPSGSRSAALLAEKLKTAAGIDLKTVTKGKSAVTLLINSKLKTGNEGYVLNVTPRSITLSATDENGLYYGVQTLLQLLPPQIESSELTSATWQVPCVNILDKPRFSYRGIMLDCSRHFSTIKEIKKLMDVMAMDKINKFHWHLTDDQGWRIEIKRYPKLTEMGAFRMENGIKYGGFYTQEQIKDVIKYAADRNIEIIPEIEMPGHAMAALYAYPEYSCTGGLFKGPRTIWGVEKDVYCAGNEATYKFVENILDEVCALFPSKYIHVGGDECPKDRWKECPKCQAKMKENGLKNEMELQSYFTKRIEKYLETKGKRLMGWDEILEGGIAPSATIMSWRGEQGGIDAANADHDVVMTPGGYLYLDHYQGDPMCETVKIGGMTTLQQTYLYDPIPKEISADKAHHVLGLQGNLWQEYMYQPKLVEYQLFPRAAAIAETGWTLPQNKNLDDFIRRIDDQQIRWDYHNINYYIPMSEGNTNNIQFSDNISLAFTTNRPVKMVYTMDGSDPTSESTVYSQPLSIDRSVTLKLRSILPQGRLSNVRVIQLTKTVPYQGLGNVDGLKSGLKMQYVKGGDLTSVDQLAFITNWTDTVVSSVTDFFKLKGDEETGGAAIFEGYIHVEKDGNYILHCLSDQLYLNGKLLINNDKMKKNATSDIQVPLTAGYYPIRIVMLNRMYGGVVSQWMSPNPTVRLVGDDSNNITTPVFYK